MRAAEQVSVEKLAHRLERERRTRIEAEAIAESATRRLYDLVGELERSKADLERLLAGQREFVTIAAHELQTPIAPIATFAQMLVSQWEQTPDDEKRRRIEVIDRQAQRLRRLTSLMLGLSRIDAGTLQVRPADIDLEGELAKLVAEMSEGRSDVTVRCPRGLSVRADPDHIQTILGNLLENALKHGSPPLSIEAQDAGGWVEIRVRDAGPGVPVDFVPRLFEKFAQANFGANRGANGTGLGLYIVRNLVRAHGGEAWSESNYPTGACLAVRLPAARAGTNEKQGEKASVWT
jgi:signal transduction histidine kinase